MRAVVHFENRSASNRLHWLRSCPMFSLVVTGILLVCGFSGNALVVVTVYFNRPLHTTHFLLLASLACCDFVSLASVVLPRMLMDWRTTDVKTSSDAWCISSTYLGKMMYFTTISHLCSVSYERYKAIVKDPLTYTAEITSRRVLLNILVNWFLPSVASIPGAVVHAQYGLNPVALSDCGTNSDENIPKTDRYLMKIANVPLYMYIIPFVAMIYMNYVTIGVAIRETKVILEQTAAIEAVDGNREGADQVGSNALLSAFKKKLIEYRAARDGLCIIGVFLICYSPTFLYVFSRLFGGTDDSHSGFLTEVFYLLLVSNCVWNPVIYSIRKRVFRNAVERLISSKSNQVSPLNWSASIVRVKQVRMIAAFCQVYVVEEQELLRTVNVM